MNVACLALTVIAATVLANIGDRLWAWIVYCVAAVLGIVYFVMTGDPVQIGLWVYFLVNDLLAVRRWKKKGLKKI